MPQIIVDTLLSPDKQTWLDKAKSVFGRKQPAPVARTQEVVGSSTQFDRKVARALGLRRNMWVVSSTFGVGILQALSADGVASVMLIGEDGQNRLSVIAQANSLRQALHAEIPGPRRPDAMTAARFGYL